MNDEEFKRHVECLMSMSSGFLLGHSDRPTFENNLKILAEKMVPHICYCCLCVQTTAKITNKDCDCEMCKGFEKKAN